MASIFCPECGAKNGYTLKKPKFCQSCGETFAAFGMTNASVSTPSRRAADEQGDDETVPQLSKLEYEIDMSTSKVTLESLVKNPLNPTEIRHISEARKGYSKMTEEEFARKSQAECSSSRGEFKDVSDGGEK